MKNVRQEKKAGRPAAASSNVFEKAVIVGWMSCSDTSPCLRPCSMSVRTTKAPRKLGSAVSRARRGAARMRPLVAASTSADGRNSNPSRSKKGPPSGHRTVLKRSCLSCRAAVRRFAASSASSGVAPSTTTMVRLLYWGNAASKASPLCLQSSCFEISWEVSAVIAKFWAVKTSAASARLPTRNSTIRGCRVLAATMRPIDKFRVNTTPLRERGAAYHPTLAEISGPRRMARTYFVISHIPPRHVVRRSHNVALIGQWR